MADDSPDPHKNLIDCPLCDDYWCLKCEKHWSSCPCPVSPTAEEGEKQKSTKKV